MTTILYVGGWGRSGSTLLSRMLAEHPQAVFVGELRDLWVRGVGENRRCGCGETFAGCPFWLEVGERALGGWDRLPVDEMDALRARVDKPWRYPQLRSGRVGDAWRGDVDRYVDVLGRVVEAIHEVSGRSIVVDSSKLATFALLLDRVPGVDVRVAHLVRDPRGQVFSWQRRKQVEEDSNSRSYMIQYSPTSASSRYLLYNLQADGLGRGRLPYTRLRYEDLVAAPLDALRQVTRDLDLPAWSPETVADGGTVRLGVSHTVIGNPMRMQSGDMALRADTEWQSEIGPGTRALVNTITLPVLTRYGYVSRTS